MKTPILQMLMCTALLMPVADAADELLPWLERSNGVFSPHEAAATGDMNLLREAQVEKHTVNMPDELGKTPLDIAAENGHASAVAHLLSVGASATEQTYRLAATETVRGLIKGAMESRRLELQLCEAVASGNLPEARKLLALGVSANAMSHDHQMSVLMQAVAVSRVWMVRVLLENGADPNYVNVQSKSVLHVAAAQSTPEIVSCLLAAGADPMMQGNNGATPLHDAVWQRRTDLVKALLPAYKSQNYNPDGGRNGTPLAMAVHNGSLPIVQAFIAAGTDLRGACFAKSPLLVVAVRAGKVEIARTLFEAGADADARDESGKSARDYAAVKMPHLFDR